MEKKLIIENSWHNLLVDEFEKPYFLNLIDQVMQEYKNNNVFPDSKNMFNAFNLTPVDMVKVVILGQDPYHGSGQAHGLSFSVPRGVKRPPSLNNIFKEVQGDLDIEVPLSGCLDGWAKQGVFLLNSTLTVREASPNSHKDVGWSVFTDSVIKKLSRLRKNIVFLLWGAHAKKKSKMIEGDSHLVLEAAHPSPLSAYNGFFGCKHFSKANKYLISKNIAEIDWGSF